jgi:hypothetical protein
MSDLPEIPQELFEIMEALTERMKVREVEHRVRLFESKADFIADNAWLCWKKDDLRFFLCESPIYKEGLRVQRENPKLYDELSVYREAGRFCGYARFPKLPLTAPGYRGIATYVPVHGGITYFQDWWDGSVTYGFDTNHAWSPEILEIANTPEWMMAETEAMARGIQIAARFEPYYLNARTEERKADILDRMGRFLPLDIHGNTGAILNLLSGEL